MPIYIYEPTIWSEEDPVEDCCSFEILQSLKEEPLKHCLICGHEIHRAVTSFSISQKTVATSKDRNDSYAALDKKKDSPAAKAAQIAMRHVCRSGCKH